MVRRLGAARCLAVASRLAALGILSIFALPLRAQTTATAVDVVPLARGAGFTVRLDLVAPDVFNPTEHGPMYQAEPWATLEWRTSGETRWKSAQPFVRVESDRFRSVPAKPDPRIATMLFGLRENTGYEYRIAFKRAGYPTAPITGEFRTLDPNPPVGPVKTVVTVGANTTTTALRAAVAAAYAKGADEVSLQSDQGPGKRTLVRAAIASIYHGGDFNWSGTADRWKRLTVAEGHDIVFDGSRAELDRIDGDNWIPYTSAERGITSAMGVYVSRNSMAAPWAVRYVRPGEEVGIVAYNINPGQKFDGGTSTGFAPSSTGKEATMITRAKANGAAWIWEADATGATTGKLYLRLHNGIDPDTVYIKIPAMSSALDLGSCHHVVVDNLTIQNYGGWGGGIGLMSVSNIVIRNNRVRNTGLFVGSRTSTNSPKNGIVIYGNTFEERGLGPDKDPSLPQPRWSWAKASVQERIGIPLMGVGVSILDNKISGIFNGVSNYAGVMTSNDQTKNNSYAIATEVDNNEFFGIGDDSIEPEQWCVNQAYTRNRFTGCYKGVSMAPVIGGPIYILRNQWLGRGEFAWENGKQAFLKLGNDDPGDPGYKLISHNSIINVNADANSLPLVGIANSGSTYNHFFYNNYVASDGYCVDMGFGVMGYPHIFDYNRYRAKRFAAWLPGYDKGFALGKIAITQGELMPGSDHRTAKTFDDWQRGRAVNSSPNWPGYDGNIPQTPRTANTPGNNRAPAQPATWLHDPHSSFSEGSPELVAPEKGDFRPVANNLLAGAGMPMANISFDCGPLWSGVEETGRPTVGAVPSTTSAPPVNLAPEVSLPSNVVGEVGKPVTLVATCTDLDGQIQSVNAVVTDPRFVLLPNQVTPGAGGSYTVGFVPAVAGAHTVKVTARDDKGDTTEQSVVVSVTSGTPLEGALAVVVTSSKAEPVPGQPVTLTITVSNPTGRMMRAAALRQTFPSQMAISTSSVKLDGVTAAATFSGGILGISLGDMAPGQTRTITASATVS